jgi:hypothetical protein
MECFYLFHYYQLENGVQRWYRLADQLEQKIGYIKLPWIDQLKAASNPFSIKSPAQYDKRGIGLMEYALKNPPHSANADNESSKLIKIQQFPWFRQFQLAL